ncbi:MAG: helix-turn-helix domain-containing protein [Christensenellales bacterium]|nr:transcriptional regulator [Clostridia bacterium]
MSTEVTAHRLKALMREKNWGVKAFANRIPADKNSVKTWLSGEYLPRYDSLVKLCDLLDVSADYVVGLSDERGGGLRLGVPLNNLKACYVERVRGLISDKGVSAEKYAEMMGVKTATVENWFSGKKFPEMALVVKSAQTLGCSLDYLLSRTDKIN